MTRCLVTGANGFVGSALVARLQRTPGLHVAAAVRRPATRFPTDVTVHHSCRLGESGTWADALAAQDCVVHAAARVHVMRDNGHDALDAYYTTNVLGTLDIARQAAACGVRRFVYLSSIKVNGERTQPGRPFRAEDTPAPCDAYGRSKQEAEERLRSLSSVTGMEVVIVRPPLVHGPGVRANFRALVTAVARGIPLPFGQVQNLRSLIALDNLVDLLATCTTHAAAPGETFLVSDGDDISTPDLIRRLARSLGRPARLLPVPVWLLEAAGTVTGRRAALQRLCNSLQVDASRTRRTLNWTPPLSLYQGLESTVAAFLTAAPASHEAQAKT